MKDASNLIIRKLQGIGKDVYQLYDDYEGKVIAQGKELALTSVSPSKEKYLYGSTFIQGYRYLSPSELDELAKERKQIFTSLEKINGKVIIEWTK